MALFPVDIDFIPPVAQPVSIPDIVGKHAVHRNFAVNLAIEE